MHFVLKQEGGFAHFPGLSKEIRLDTADLSEDEADELKRCVNECSFFDLPEKPEPSKSADARTYILTVRQGELRHTVRIPEPIEAGPLKTLIESLRSHESPNRD